MHITKEDHCQKIFSKLYIQYILWYYSISKNMVSVNITLPKSTTVPREDGKLCFLFLPTKSQKINLSMLYIYCSSTRERQSQTVTSSMYWFYFFFQRILHASVSKIFLCCYSFIYSLKIITNAFNYSSPQKCQQVRFYVLCLNNNSRVIFSI